MYNRQNTREPIKVLHIITRLDQGGSADNTLCTVLLLNRNNFTSSLVYGKTVNPSPLLKRVNQRKDIAIFYLPSLVRNISPFKDVLTFFKLHKIIKNEKYDIVHTHTSKAGILGRLAAKICNVKLIIHTPHGHIFQGYFGRIKTRLFITLEKMAAKWCNIIVMLTDKGKTEHLQKRIGEESQFKTIHSGVMIEKYKYSGLTRVKLRKRWAIPKEAVLVGSIGRLTDIKGHRYLLEAMSVLCLKYPLLYLMIVGEGPLVEEIEEYTVSHGLGERVILTGYLPNTAPLYSAFDIFVLPSLNEGMGRVLVEAMAAGLPIVASNAGGISEIINDGTNGLLTLPADSSSIYNAVDRLLQNKTLCQKIKENNFKDAQKWSLISMIELIETLYSDTLESIKE